MFDMFPGDYSRTQAANMAIRSGLQVGEVIRAVGELTQRPHVPSEWYTTWTRFAEQLTDLAADEYEDGYTIASGERLLRASTALYIAQARIPSRAMRIDALNEHWDVFAEGARRARIGYERVEFDSEDGTLSAWWMPGRLDGPSPALIFYPGFDLDKEMLVLTLRDCFQRRGIGVLVLDGPGIGETLWRGCIPSRPDFEVPTRSAMDYLGTRSDVDHATIGVAGISLGGYYSTRAAAFEPELACCVAWGAVKDFGSGARRRAEHTEGALTPNPQLMAVMGTDTMEAAVERVQQWNLVGKLGGLRQPFLLIHGELDRQATLADAKAVFREVPAEDKLLRVYTAGEGGALHCQIDEPIASRELMSDWAAIRLGTAKPA